jgi:hypothetical protein
MQKQAMWQFFRHSRGESYAALYRTTIAIVSLLWLLAATALSPALFFRKGGSAVVRLWRKWLGCLQWALGLQNLTQKFPGQVPSRAASASDILPDSHV